MISATEVPMGTSATLFGRLLRKQTHWSMKPWISDQMKQT